MEKICLNCNTAVDASFKFCPACGGSLFKEKEEPASNGAVPVPVININSPSAVDDAPTQAAGSQLGSSLGDGIGGAVPGQQAGQALGGGFNGQPAGDKTVAVDRHDAPQEGQGYPNNGQQGYAPNQGYQNYVQQGYAPNQGYQNYVQQGYAPNQGYQNNGQQVYIPNQGYQNYGDRGNGGIGGGISSAVSALKPKKSIKKWVIGIISSLVAAGAVTGGVIYYVNHTENNKTENNKTENNQTNINANYIGQVSDNCYTNEWANLKFSFENGWTQDTALDKVDLGSEFEYAFSASGSDASNVAMYIVQGGQSYTADSFFDDKLDVFYDYIETDLQEEFDEQLESYLGDSGMLGYIDIKFTHSTDQRFDYTVADENYRAVKITISAGYDLYGQSISIPYGYWYLCAKEKEGKIILLASFSTADHMAKGGINNFQPFK